jgi:hypothetical protein
MERPSIAEVEQRPEWMPYSRTFARLMFELGGWSQTQANQHLDARLRNDGFRSWFPHDNPSDEAAPLLMPDDLREQLQGVPFVKLRERICEAIDRRGDQHNANPDNDSTYDWEAARRRVSQTIMEFRQSEKLDG